MPRIGMLLVAAVLQAVSPAPKRHTVIMTQFQFSPRVLHAAGGDTVVFENRDIVPHTATADKGKWDSRDIPAKGRFVMVVRTKGEQPFTCLYHSNMKGKLVVD